MTRPILIADDMEQQRCGDELKALFGRMISQLVIAVQQGLAGPDLREVEHHVKEALKRWETPGMTVEVVTTQRVEAPVTRFTMLVKWPPRTQMRPGSAVSSFLDTEPPRGTGLQLEQWEGLTLATHKDVSDAELRMRMRGPEATNVSVDEANTLDPDTLAAIFADPGTDVEEAPVRGLRDVDFAERMRRKREKV